MACSSTEMSARAFSAIARSWLGMTLIATTVASRPMMTTTTISSTRVKPRARRDGERKPGRKREACMAGTSTKDQGVELQDREQDREHDDRHHAAEHDDDRRLQQAHRGACEGVELAFQVIGGALEHRRQAAAVLAAGGHVEQGGREDPGAAHRRRQAAALADG